MIERPDPDVIQDALNVLEAKATTRASRAALETVRLEIWRARTNESRLDEFRDTITTAVEEAKP